MSKYIPYGFIIVLSLYILYGCVKEDHFGKSDLKEIFYFSLPQQSGNSIIIKDSLIIRVTVAPTADLTKLYADSVRLSSYATISPGVDVVQDFTKPVQYTVTAENGTQVIYTVIVRKESTTPQLENAGLDDWYTPVGKNYQEPGKDESTIWASGNAGVVTLGQANVKAFIIQGADLGAEMITRDLGSLAQLTGQRMAAGSIFTGDFILDISNPLNSTKFGVPFVGRPASFTVSYKYVPGTPYKNGQGTTLNKPDSCDIYLLLENRNNNQVKRVATGWFRDGKQQDTFKDITVNLTYGPLAAGNPVYMFPANGLFGSANDEVTHISFVAASSAYGAYFEGGTNTTLIINNIRLNY